MNIHFYMHPFLPLLFYTYHFSCSTSQLIAALGGLGILSSKDYSSPQLEDIIHLLWREAQLDYNELKLEIEHPNGRDVELELNKDLSKICCGPEVRRNVVGQVQITSNELGASSARCQELLRVYVVCVSFS